uniref:Uncharacterized protein n=2 Tax=Panagrolaimus sp. PS1159 TaxID=55785 RepID=A0AC35FEX1_9BILA
MLPHLKMFTEFPHKYIRYYFMKYEEKISTPVSANVLKNIENYETLYWKIIKADNVETWFEYLEEANNFDFLKHNVENRLCFNLYDKTLWKMYIYYLKTVNPYEMLHVYSKYCGYFLEDFDMLEKYEQEVAIHGPIYVTWHNPFDFETIGYYKPGQSPFYYEAEDENMIDYFDE